MGGLLSTRLTYHHHHHLLLVLKKKKEERKKKSLALYNLVAKTTSRKLPPPYPLPPHIASRLQTLFISVARGLLIIDIYAGFWLLSLLAEKFRQFFNVPTEINFYHPDVKVLFPPNTFCFSFHSCERRSIREYQFRTDHREDKCSFEIVFLRRRKYRSNKFVGYNIPFW